MREIYCKIAAFKRVDSLNDINIDTSVTPEPSL